MKDEMMKLDIHGMTCTACAARIEKAVGKMDGVETVSVHFASGQALVRYRGAKELEEQIKAKIVKLGFTLKSAARGGMGDEVKEYRNRFIISAALTLPLVWTMFTHFSFTSSLWIPELFLNPWLQFALAAPVQLLLGMPFYFNAYHALMHKTATMDVLVALGTSAAFFYSHYILFNDIAGHLYFETSAVIITVIFLGKWLEALAKRRTQRAVRLFQSLQAKDAAVVRDGVERRIPVEEIRVGDVLKIRPGENVPVDGQVLSGYSAVDESLVTGESLPVEKQAGDSLLSGTINKNGVLTISVVRRAPDSALARMVRLMEEGIHAKPAIQRTADRLANVFVPLIVGLALLTFTAWFWLFTPGDFGGALTKAIAVVIIACPCALGLATPISVMVGIGRAAEKGIFFKEGQVMEALQRINTVMLDKTGTLTEGKAKMTDVFAVEGHGREVLRWAAAAEQHSEHPYAQAVLAAAKRERLLIPAVERTEAVPGRGIVALVNGAVVRVGTRKWLEEHEVGKMTLAASSGRFGELERWETEGKTVLYVSVSGNFIGVLAVEDSLKSTSPKAVRKLKRLGLDVVMLTGDNRLTAERIARRTGIRTVIAEALPERKLAEVQRYQSRGSKVAMVGDGINDAPALAAADIGVALGTGTDIAAAAADVHLLRGNVGDVAEAVYISRKTMSNIRQNLAFALMYNMIALPFAAMGRLEPWMAGAAMALSSVTVIYNALRLQRL